MFLFRAGAGPPPRASGAPSGGVGVCRSCFFALLPQRVLAPSGVAGLALGGDAAWRHRHRWGALLFWRGGGDRPHLVRREGGNAIGRISFLRTDGCRWHGTRFPAAGRARPRASDAVFRCHPPPPPSRPRTGSPFLFRVEFSHFLHHFLLHWRALRACFLLSTPTRLPSAFSSRWPHL